MKLKTTVRNSLPRYDNRGVKLLLDSAERSEWAFPLEDRNRFVPGGMPIIALFSDAGPSVVFSFAFRDEMTPRQENPFRRTNWRPFKDGERKYGLRGEIWTDDLSSASLSVFVATSGSSRASEAVHLGPLEDNAHLDIVLTENSPRRLLLQGRHTVAGRRTLNRRCRVSCSDGLEKEGCIDCDLGELLIRTCC